jgi:hypothetical protein
MGKGPSSSRVSTRTWTQQRPAASCSEGMVEICPTKLRMLSLQPGMHLCRRFQRDCRRARRCTCLALAKKSGVNFVGFVFNSFHKFDLSRKFEPSRSVIVHSETCGNIWKSGKSSCSTSNYPIALQQLNGTEQPNGNNTFTKLSQVVVAMVRT